MNSPYYEPCHCPSLHVFDVKFVWENGHYYALNPACPVCRKDFIGVGEPNVRLVPKMDIDLLWDYLTDKEKDLCCLRVAGTSKSLSSPPFDKIGVGEVFTFREAMIEMVQHKMAMAQ